MTQKVVTDRVAKQNGKRKQLHKIDANSINAHFEKRTRYERALKRNFQPNDVKSTDPKNSSNSLDYVVVISEMVAKPHKVSKKGTKNTSKSTLVELNANDVVEIPKLSLEEEAVKMMHAMQRLEARMKDLRGTLRKFYSGFAYVHRKL